MGCTSSANGSKPVLRSDGNDPYWLDPPLPSPLPKPNKLPTYSKRMRQLWGEVEGADADVVEETTDVVAVEDVEV